MTYISDLYAVLKGDGIALDETEAALIGAPNGETISLFSAIEARHGWIAAKVMCAILSVLVQPGHCQKQIIGDPMPGVDYLRAFVLLCVPVAALARLIWWIA